MDVRPTRSVPQRGHPQAQAHPWRRPWTPARAADGLPPAHGPSDHVLGHLSPSQRRVALVLSRAVTIDDAAAELHMTRRSLEHQWHALRDRLALTGEGPGSSGVSRVALTRVLLGIDPCHCGRSR